MALRYPRIYPQKAQNCTAPHNLVMIHQEDASQAMIALDITKPVVMLKASYVSTYNGKPVKDKLVPVIGPTTVYLARARSDKYVGWYYIVRWSEAAQKHICTCSENQGQGYCQHVDDLPAATESVA